MIAGLTGIGVPAAVALEGPVVSARGVVCVAGRCRATTWAVDCDPQAASAMAAAQAAPALNAARLFAFAA